MATANNTQSTAAKQQAAAKREAGASARSINLLKKIKKEDLFRYVSEHEHYKMLSPFEMRQALAPEETSVLAETYLTRWVPTVEGFRNALVVLPITATWLSLAIAAVAYQQSVAMLKGGTAPSFFQLWQEGFPKLKSVQLWIWTIPLNSGHAHYFTFSGVALSDFTILALMFLHTVGAQVVSAYGSYRGRMLQMWLEEQLYGLSVKYLTWSQRPDAQDANWASKVEEALMRLNIALGGVREAVMGFNKTLSDQGGVVSSMLDNTGDITRTVKDLTGIYQVMQEGSREIRNTLPGVAENIRTVTRGQENTASTWRHAADQLDRASRSLAAIASGLTNDPSYEEQ